jgi:hypothetical protein
MSKYDRGGASIQLSLPDSTLRIREVDMRARERGRFRQARFENAIVERAIGPPGKLPGQDAPGVT